MADTVFADEPQTVELLQSMRILMRWLSLYQRKYGNGFSAACGM